jgi:zona occludens toxin (predicted ATPase)
MRQRQRSRRGVEAIEFAMILPVFITMIFMIIEFSWYMFQRNAMVDIARNACQAAASLDPEQDDFVTAATTEITEALKDGGAGAGIDCDSGEYLCNISITELSNPSRIVCDIRTNYRSLSGFIPASDGIGMGQRTWNSEGVLPENVRGRSVAIFEEAD